MSYRRIGSIIWTGASSIQAFRQTGIGADRTYYLEVIDGTNRLLSAGASTSWSPLVGSAYASAFTTDFYFNLNMEPNTGVALGVRARNDVGTGTGAGVLPGEIYGLTESSITIVTMAWCPCDPAQCIDYVAFVVGGVGGGCYIDVAGYRESV